MKIFLSHRSSNKPLVREFKEHLPNFLHTWLDEDSLSWADPLSKKLKHSIKSDVDFLIVFLDSETLKSNWVRKEIEWAIEREKELQRTFVLPIILEASLLQDENLNNLQFNLEERKYLTLKDFDKPSIKSLADETTLKLFDLVIKSLSDLKYENSSINKYDSLPKFFKSIIDNLPKVGKIVKENSLYRIALDLISSTWKVNYEEYYKGTFIIYSPWITDRMVKDMYKNAKSSVFSTCVTQYLHQWDSRHGEDLLDAHRYSQASVTRVFIFKNNSEIDELAHKIMRRHESEGIDVRVYIKSKQREHPLLHSERQDDFTVIDKGDAIGVTTNYLTEDKEEKTQATWYFSDQKRYSKYKTMIDILTDGVPTLKEYFESIGN
ncbi:MAG: toll/interleukin-1 receptor domain-containing protein [Xenococcus sp. (in: cyanobacteria)]